MILTRFLLGLSVAVAVLRRLQESLRPRDSAREIEALAIRAFHLANPELRAAEPQPGLWHPDLWHPDRQA